MAKKAVKEAEVNEDLALLVQRLKDEGHIEYLSENSDQAEECWVVWDIGEYALDHPQEICVSMFKTPEEAAQAWAKFQIRGNSES